MSRAETGDGSRRQGIAEYFSFNDTTGLPLLRYFQVPILSAIGGKGGLKNVAEFEGGRRYASGEKGFRQHFHDFVAQIPTFSEFLREQVRNQHLNSQGEPSAVEFTLGEVLALSDSARIQQLDASIVELRSLGAVAPEELNLNKVRELAARTCVLMFGDESADHFRGLFVVSGEIDLARRESSHDPPDDFRPARHFDRRAPWLSRMQIISATGMCADMINDLQIATMAWSHDDVSNFHARLGYPAGEKGFRQMLKAHLQVLPTYTEYIRQRVHRFPEVSLHDVITLDNIDRIKQLDEICLHLRAIGDLPEDQINLPELYDLYVRADAIIYGKV